MIALHKAASLGGQLTFLRSRLNPLCDDVHSKAFAETENSSDNCGILGAIRHFSNEGSVDLYDVYRELAKVR